MTRNSSSTDPLLLPTNGTSDADDELYLAPLPPFSDQSGAFRYYMIWTWRFLIFSATGGSSLRICNMLLQRLFHLSISSVGLILYALLVTLLELLFVYPLTLFVIGSFLGQRRFFGRVIYKGWGSWLLPLSIRKKWVRSNWL
ncbi:hypothetical protein BCR42DRAFT_441137 [Absidia repens]|uniref:Uncharacterized protein n=1 Tax=Absidia repens TaxID=90262 RepID=A0A1X2I6Q2_9FUNG|nr:hypothetical protein BCR42DRAFT_441137 [Absidia repens]